MNINIIDYSIQEVGKIIFFTSDILTFVDK